MVDQVSVPMYLKKSLGRTIVQHPTRITSDLIRRDLLQHRVLGPESDSASLENWLKEDVNLGELYSRHPVTIQARREGLRPEHIVPVSVYFDGVQYTQNENFLGFYVTNLRSGQQRLVWLLRSLETLRNKPLKNIRYTIVVVLYWFSKPIHTRVPDLEESPRTTCKHNSYKDFQSSAAADAEGGVLCGHCWNISGQMCLDITKASELPSWILKLIGQQWSRWQDYARGLIVSIAARAAWRRSHS